MERKSLDQLARELARTELEDSLAFEIRALRLPEPERQWRFHPTRKWRFDFAWPDRKLACEVDGGEWIKGRHNTGRGMRSDSEKYSQAAILGWRVIRVTGSMVKDGEAGRIVEAALEP